MGKIVTKEQMSEIRQGLRDKTVVLCHGVFDLVHPGHIIHFEEAKAMGDVLVVSITAAKYVRKGPDRPYFDDELRLKFLSEISVIDYVILSEAYTAQDIIEVVEPNLYVKGEEYKKAEDDITGKITEEEKMVISHGGKLAFTKGQVFSSTKLINNGLSALSDDVKKFSVEFCKKHSINEIKKITDQMQKLKVLVIGDAIIDEYVYCNVQGLMSKDMGYSTRFKTQEQYLGGTLAVANHLSSFCDNVTLMSVVGNETDIHSKILDGLSERMRIDLTFSDEFETIVKRRFVSVNEKREELNKIFAINNLPEVMKIDGETMTHFYDKLSEKIASYDLVVLCDFGHGLVDSKVMKIVQEEAKVLALNCQTNSSNYGKNIITKYNRADYFALDQKELGLAFPNYIQSEKDKLIQLEKHLKGYGWLTRGSNGAYSIENSDIKECPAFTLKVKDTIGAGDAFFAIASLTAAAGGTIEMGTFMGNIAGALAANIAGNKEAIEKINVLKYASTLLNV